MQDLNSNIASARSVGNIPFENAGFPFSSIGRMLFERAEVFPDRLWLTYFDELGERRTWTYREFRDTVQRVAAYLKRAGVGVGDRIAVIGHNHSDTVIQYYAAWWIGATVVPINVGEDDDRIAYIINHSHANTGFIREEYVERITSLQAQLPDFTHIVHCGTPSGNHPEFAELLSDPSHENLLPESDLQNQECLIVYTSGTTGNPKGVVLAQGNLLMDGKGISEWHGITPDAPMMCVLPIHHVNGIVVTLVTPMVAGTGVVLNRKFQTGTFFRRIAEERVGVVSVVPTLLAFLLEGDVDIQGYDLSAFRHIICGAGPLTCELAQRFEDRYRFPIMHGYGLSETTCYSCFLPITLPDSMHRSWLNDHGFPSIGVPIPQNQMAIHDSEGNPVPAGERGEIVIRGHNVMMEYYDNTEANESAFAHGWFRSGDEGFYVNGDDGLDYFFITGRLKELIIRGGINISPLEIDEVINMHPKVSAGIAVGFENHWYGEEVGAYVRCADPSLTAEELLEYCSEYLPYFKTPKVVIFGDDIPVTSTGKYQRNKVKYLFGEFKEMRFTNKER